MLSAERADQLRRIGDGASSAASHGDAPIQPDASNVLYIYGTTACPWCHKATQLCDAHNIPYKFVTATPEHGIRTVPQVWKHVGGYQELEQMVTLQYTTPNEGTKS